MLKCQLSFVFADLGKGMGVNIYNTPVKNMQELISVIIPVYNVGKYLQRCIDSVLRQTYQNLEIILVDDGSEDVSGDICEFNKSKDRRIQVIHKENGGQSDARNTGIAVAAGEYITFLDSDDYVASDYVEYLYTLIRIYHADISTCKNVKVSIEEEREMVSRGEPLILNGVEAAKHNLYQKNISTPPWGKLYRMNLFQGIKYPIGKIYEDLGTTYKLLAKANRVAVGNEVKYFYWQNQNGTMSRDFSPQKMDRVEMAGQVLQDVRENIPDLLSAAESRFFLANVQVLREVPFNRKYQSEIRILKTNIKEYRKRVMKDSETKRITRLMAMSSYLGFRFMKVEGIVYKKLIEGKIS